MPIPGDHLDEEAPGFQLWSKLCLRLVLVDWLLSGPSMWRRGQHSFCSFSVAFGCLSCVGTHVLESHAYYGLECLYPEGRIACYFAVIALAMGRVSDTDVAEASLVIVSLPPLCVVMSLVFCCRQSRCRWMAGDASWLLGSVEIVGRASCGEHVGPFS